MAKMLDALERARQERQRKMQAEGQNGRETVASESAVPEPEPAAPAAAPLAPPAPALAPLREQEAGDISELIVGIHDEHSPITEQVRQIRTNLETVLADYRSRTLVISSPVAGDGKTLVVANLATVLADDLHQQVLVIDADMRKPDQNRLFGAPLTPGLGEYLRGKCEVREIVRETRLPNLKIIPAGRLPEKPTVLLGSDRMITLLGEMQRQYRWILIDTPPMLPVTDALVLGRECTGVILVIRMGQTSEKVVMRAQDQLAEMRLPVLGCILNDFTNHSRENAYYYRYYRRGEGGFAA